MGIYVSGVSKIPHEADVCVVRRDEAEFCRTPGALILPRYSSIKLAVECKFYQSANAGISVGRGFMGLSKELGSRPSYFVATRATDQVDAMLAHYGYRRGSSIVPTSADDVDRLRRSFETVFQDFKARR